MVDISSQRQKTALSGRSPAQKPNAIHRVYCSAMAANLPCAQPPFHVLSRQLKARREAAELLSYIDIRANRRSRRPVNRGYWRVLRREGRRWARVRAQRTAAIWRPLPMELDFATQVAYCGINN